MAFREIRRRVRHLFQRDQFASDLNDEMRLHIELRARKLQTLGVNNASSAAQRQFGNRTAIQEISSEMWGWAAWERLAQDIRYATRTLLKTPTFTVVAVLTLALGLGINTAVFSVVNAVMIRRLPYPEPDRVVSLWGRFLREVPGFVSPEAKWGGPPRTNLSPAEWMDFRQCRALADLAAFQNSPKNLTGIGNPERISGESVTANFLPLLGANPVLGRTFLPEEDRPGAAHVVILAYSFWQQRLGGDARVLEQSILLDGLSYRVIGVLAPGFQSPEEFEQAVPVEFYIPAAFNAKNFAERGHRFVNLVGRMSAGATVERVQTELDAITASVDPSPNRNRRTMVTPLQDDLLRHVRKSLLALLGASGLIVLVTCVNVASLLLVRAIARRHETSVRFALGAGRLRIVRQFLVESILVALAGSCTGVVLGQVMLRLLISMAPTDIPRIASVTMDWRVFAVATALATITGMFFGIAPALQASRTKPVDSLKSGTRNTGGKAHAQWRMGLTIAEMALSLILLIGAGLLLKSFVRLMGVDLGFHPERVLAMTIELPEGSYGTAEQQLQFFEQLAERTKGLPAVQSVAFANSMPLRGGWSTGITVDAKEEVYVGTDAQVVSPGYFVTVGTSLLRGRIIAPEDRNGAPPVAVVNQEFARRFLNGADPIGKQVHWGAQGPRITIVGVINDLRRAGKEAPIRPQLYLPAAQTSLYPPHLELTAFAVRTAGDPRQLVNAIQEQLWSVDRNQPVTRVQTFEEMIGASASERRFETLLLMVFAAVAVGLAMIGVFGVLSYSVNQRTSEFGIRIALGAQAGSILAMMLRQAGKMITAGVAIGLAGAIVLTRFLESMLFEVRRNDVWTYLAAAALLSVVSIAASLIPARRGARVDPIVALRYE